MVLTQSVRCENEPKISSAACFLYIAQFRNSHLSLEEMVAKQSAWTTLSHQDRKPWMDSADKLRREYERQICEYREKGYYDK